MIAVPAGVRVLVATKPVDFRRGADSPAALVSEQLKHDPFSGTIFIFRSKRADRLKTPVANAVVDRSPGYAQQPGGMLQRDAAADTTFETRFGFGCRQRHMSSWSTGRKRTFSATGDWTSKRGSKSLLHGWLVSRTRQVRVSFLRGEAGQKPSQP